MGLFDIFRGDREFHVNFDGVDLSYPDEVTIGNNQRVNTTIRTEGGSDNYVIDEIQLYLDSDDGTRYLAGEELDAAIGGGIDRELTFNVTVDGERTRELADAEYITPGEQYQLRSHVVLSELGRRDPQVQDYWDDDNGDGMRFVE